MRQMTRSGETRIACRVLGERYGVKRPLGGVWHKLENNSEMNFVLYLSR